MVNMPRLVNNDDLKPINRELQEVSRNNVSLLPSKHEGRVIIEAWGQKHELIAEKLISPTQSEIGAMITNGKLLFLKHPSKRALHALADANYITFPGHGINLIIPGLIIKVPEKKGEIQERQAKLAGASGVIAETLMLFKDRSWTIRELCEKSSVSVALTHRVLRRLVDLEILFTVNRKVRLGSMSGLGRLWSMEERAPRVTRTYIYSSSIEKLAERVCARISGSAIGGTFAANIYVPTLSAVPYPLTIWIPKETLDPTKELSELGASVVIEGANVVFQSDSGNYWMRHSESKGSLRVVSPARAWTEIVGKTGRIEELEQALLNSLGRNGDNK